MTKLHGSWPRGVKVSQGDDAPDGPFGRMFPHLPARRPTGLPLAEEFGLPGGKLDGGQTTEDQDSPSIPAGFTFLCQFIDHNITFDPTSVLGQHADVHKLVDFRPPRLDLANLYGSGPTVQPYLYDPDSHATKLALSADGVDLARTGAGTALIGDPRNDENMLLAQLHLAMIKFHNAIVDGLRSGMFTDAHANVLPPKPSDEPPTEQPGVPLNLLDDVDNYYDRVLARAQQLASWHYQWIIVHEVLPLFGDPDVVADVERNGPRFFRPGAQPFMPVEFSVAGFRALGHPTIRSSYQINANFSGKIFPDNPDAPASPRTDLRGGRVDATTALDFSFFFPADPARQPQFAKRFNAKLNSQLLDLPVSAVPGAEEGALARPVASLAVRNLLRSETQELPSGQDVARELGEEPLTDEQLDSSGPTYLWYYLLKEAQILGNEARLGPVGTRLVAETLIGLLEADETSYRAAQPRWRPTLPGDGASFGIVDLLRIAGVTSA